MMEHLLANTVGLLIIAYFHFWEPEPMLFVTPQIDLIAELDAAMTHLQDTVNNA